MNIAVVIPALNEAGSIGELVRETLAQPVAGVIVVDNGSADGTALEARRAGAQVVVERRRGYGHACAAGVAAAQGADGLVFLDGDYSMLPREMPRLIAPLQEGQADLVLGSRALGHIEPGSMPAPQRFGNWLAAALTRLLYGVRVTDLSPYRAVRRDVLLKLEMREMTYGWPTEMIVKAARCRARILEVPVSCRSRRAGKSKVGGTLRGTLLAGYSILGVTLRYLSWKQPMSVL